MAEGIKCRVCGKLWKHKTPVNPRGFVCGDCCKFHELHQDGPTGVEGWEVPTLSFAATFRFKRKQPGSNEDDPCFENSVRAIEDREAA